MDVNLNSKTLFAFMQAVQDPGRVERILVLANELNLANPQTRDEVVAHVRSHPRAAAAFVERPRMRITDLSKLAELPEGTLGRTYADAFIPKNLKPADTIIPTLPLGDDREYAVVHMNETHDVWHIVTGFGTDIAGELGLQAFYAAQLSLNLPHAVLAAGFVNTMLFAWGDRHRRLSAICRGYILGLRADMLFGVPWASWLERPLADVRRDLKIDLSLLEQVMPA
ncbi:MAG TPA: Coq4 family protein [Myxococcales bacterium]|jgi:ubiquinone biosynthesis protein Coq4|nr:Coq4 family protein [Myxococcales bacterium]